MGDQQRIKGVAIENSLQFLESAFVIHAKSLPRRRMRGIRFGLRVIVLNFSASSALRALQFKIWGSDVDVKP
jgi:hypothetical protein